MARREPVVGRILEGHVQERLDAVAGKEVAVPLGIKHGKAETAGLLAFMKSFG